MMVQVTPNADPRIRYDITVNGPGNITLNAVRNLDTNEEWDVTEPEAIALWAAQMARNALAVKAVVAFDSISFSDYERKDVDGVVEYSIMVDFREEWEDPIMDAFEADTDLANAMTAGDLTFIWIS